MYWDDDDLTIVPYERKEKKYHCGKELLKLDTDRKIKYTILVLDLQEAYCANVFTDGGIEKIFDIHSTIPNKQRQGGQSQRRFERVREGCIIEWFKRLNEYLKKINDRIYIGVSFVYKERFKKYLSTENLNKIVDYDKTEYTGICGIYQYVNKIEHKLD